MKGQPSDYIALSKLTHRSDEGVWTVLANIGERCDKVPKTAFEWLTLDVDIKFEKAEVRFTDEAKRKRNTLISPPEAEE